MNKIFNVLAVLMLLFVVGCVSAPESEVANTEASVVAELTDEIVRLHYQRLDDDYTDWGLHVWGADYDGDPVEWTAALEPTGIDEFGAYWDIAWLGGDDLNFIIHRGDEKDPDGDRLFEGLDIYNEFWALSGDSTLYTSVEDTK